MDLSERLKTIRMKRHLSQQQLADRAGVKRTTIANIEQGIVERSSYIVEIAGALNIDATWLATGIPQPKDVE